MAREFEGEDFADAVFWGVDLRRAYFRDIDLTEARFFHGRFADVSLDGVIERISINGVDVTEYVNARDRWFPLRTQLEPTSMAEVVVAWSTLKNHWSDLLARVESAGGDTAHRSINGEWSLLQTLRHLIFVHDKWFRWPLLGEHLFTDMGLPNTGSQGGDWPGWDKDAIPTLSDVIDVRVASQRRFDDFISSTSWEQIPGEVDVLENGRVPGLMCLHAVLEEEFEHLRYMVRDLEDIVNDAR